MNTQDTERDVEIRSLSDDELDGVAGGRPTSEQALSGGLLALQTVCLPAVQSVATTF